MTPVQRLQGSKGMPLRGQGSMACRRRRPAMQAEAYTGVF